MMDAILDVLRASAVKPASQSLPVSDDAVRFAVNLGAIVHNLLGEYEHAMTTGEYERFVAKMYELSDEFRSERGVALREEMRREWVRRCRAKDDE